MRDHRVVRSLVAGSAAVLVLALSMSDSDAQTSPSPPAFDGSASADGIRLLLDVPGAPLSQRLVDVGAPTAQAAANSIGTSRGYAAFPDPGQLVQSAPGLLAGLLGQGGFGLPPISLPTLPGYPLLVASDVNGQQDPSMGEGPYSLHAHSEPNNSSASASGGVQTGVAGNAALVKAEASTGVTDAGTVVATSTSTVEGLVIGPLSLGKVTSTATMTLAADGTVTPSSKISIEAIRIGGIAVGIDDKGLVIPGLGTVPLPIGKVLSDLLSSAGISVQVMAGQQFPNSVIAPAIVVSMPFETDLGSAPGTLSLTFGAATAAITGVSPRTPRPPVAAPPAVGSAPATSSSSSSGGLGSGGTVGGGSLGSSASTPASNSQATAAPTVDAEPTALVGLFDIRSSYLTLTACALGAYALGQMIRLLGVRSRWTSIAG